MLHVWLVGFCSALVSLGVAAPKLSNNIRIIGGDDIDIKMVPYQVSIQHLGNHFCGGSIISDRYVLTAGHCVSNINTKLIIEYGVDSGSNQVHNGTLTWLKETFVHPKYSSMDYDVGIIELRTPIPLNEKNQPIRLAEIEPKDNTTALVAGWGWMDLNQPALSHFLQGINVSVINSETCQSNYEKVNYTLTDRMLCAGAPGKDSCFGDSGGALIAGGVQIGIVSWGYACGLNGYPGIYTNIAHREIRSFIKKVTNL